MHSFLLNGAERNFALNIEAEARALWRATYAAVVAKLLNEAECNPCSEAVAHADEAEESYLTGYLTDAALAFRRDNGSVALAWASRGVEVEE